MSIPEGTICRIVNVDHEDFRDNLQKIVATASGYTESGNRRIMCLEPILGSSWLYGLHRLPAGTMCAMRERNLRPLGDEGPEERDLFGLPEEEAHKHIASLNTKLDEACRRLDEVSKKVPR